MDNTDVSNMDNKFELNKSVVLFESNNFQIMLEIFSLEKQASIVLKQNGKEPKEITQKHPFEHWSKENTLDAVVGKLKTEHGIEIDNEKTFQIDIKSITSAFASIVEKFERDLKGEQTTKHCLDVKELLESGTSKTVFEIAEYIKKHTKFITFRDSEQIYFYDDGIYNKNAEVIIKELARELLSDSATKNIINEIIAAIKDTTHVNREEVENKTPPELVCLKNGVLNIFKPEEGLQQHSPDFVFFQKLPIEYDKEADCPTIKEFFKQVLYEKDIAVMQEAIGYTLYRGLPFHNAFMTVGGGRNGKGTTMRLIQSFLGKDNCASVELQRIGRDKFVSVDLYQRYANVCADLGYKPFKYTDTFKKLTGQDTIRGEEKYQKAFNFVSFAKHWYSTNRPPEVKDDSIAFWDRWI
jgi:putative DNA primase/helicase